jgi:MFS family permease
MDLRNRLGLHGAYLLATAAIGFTLPYLPLYLSQRGLSDQAIGVISTLAALSALGQFPIGVWSDRLSARKPFILAALAVLASATIALPWASGLMGLGIVVVFFAENGIGRAVIESQTGALAVALAPGEVGRALGRLRFWKPIGIIVVALVGGRLVDRLGLDVMMIPLAAASVVGFLLALLIHEPSSEPQSSTCVTAAQLRPIINRDPALWWFITVMVLFHAANAPAGVYLGLFLTRDLAAGPHQLADAFVVSMIMWMIVARPAGVLADRFGRRPLLIVCWAAMALRLLLLSWAGGPRSVIAIQALDGFANGLFAVLAAAWVTDRLGGMASAGRAQAIVGTSLVLGSAVGPAASAVMVDQLGYRGLFTLLAGLGFLALGLLVALVPESLNRSTGIVDLDNTLAADTVSA